MSRNQLLELRHKVHGDLKQLVEAVERAGGDPTDEQRAEMDRLESEFNSLDSRLARQQTVDEMERRMSGSPITGAGGDRLEHEVRSRYSLNRHIAGLAGLEVDWGFEREASAEYAKRARNAGRAAEGAQVPFVALEKRVTLAGGSGGALVPETMAGFIDLLRPQLVTARLGATVLNGLSGNVAIPRRTKSTVAQWVTENEPLNFSDQEFDQITVTPKTCGAITELSRLMILQSSPDVEALTRQDLLATVAQAVDHAALFGSGVGAEPRGVYNTPGVPTVVMSATPTWAEVLAFTSFVEQSDIEGNGWAMHPRARTKLRATIKAPGEGAGYLMDDALSLAGYPVAVSSAVPSNLGAGTDEGGIIYGRWSDLLVCTWGESFSLLVNPYESLAYRKGNIQVRVMLSADVAVRHPESFARGSVVLP